MQASSAAHPTRASHAFPAMLSSPTHRLSRRRGVTKLATPWAKAVESLSGPRAGDSMENTSSPQSRLTQVHRSASPTGIPLFAVGRAISVLVVVCVELLLVRRARFTTRPWLCKTQVVPSRANQSGTFRRPSTVDAPVSLATPASLRACYVSPGLSSRLQVPDQVSRLPGAAHAPNAGWPQSRHCSPLSLCRPALYPHMPPSQS
jgi:hypothetical protein